MTRRPARPTSLDNASTLELDAEASTVAVEELPREDTPETSIEPEATAEEPEPEPREPFNAPGWLAGICQNAPSQWAASKFVALNGPAAQFTSAIREALSNGWEIGGEPTVADLVALFTAGQVNGLEAPARAALEAWCRALAEEQAPVLARYHARRTAEAKARAERERRAYEANTEARAAEERRVKFEAEEAEHRRWANYAKLQADYEAYLRRQQAGGE